MGFAQNVSGNCDLLNQWTMLNDPIERLTDWIFGYLFPAPQVTDYGLLRGNPECSVEPVSDQVNRRQKQTLLTYQGNCWTFPNWGSLRLQLS